MMNAANLAYQKALKKTRDKEYLKQHHPLWMQYFAEQLPESVKKVNMKRHETVRHRKERILAKSSHWYPRLGWKAYVSCTSQPWFEAFIMLNILLVGLATGLDLEFDGADPNVTTYVNIVSIFTQCVFTLECALKIMAEGFEPLHYFSDPDDGAFNTFDFSIVAMGFLFMGLDGGGAVGSLRMLRLIRLLTFVKGVPQLRAIVAGLAKGIGSVTYIVTLLILIIYLFAIMGCLYFGANDAVRFGTVAMSMLTLFQVSTLASWTSVAYTSWWGCGDYLGDPYAAAGDDAPAVIETRFGNFQGYRCEAPEAKPIEVFFFYTIFVIITAWVVLSLFIGVMSLGMFEAFEEMKAKNKEKMYRQRLEENASIGEDDAEGGSNLQVLIEAALSSKLEAEDLKGDWRAEAQVMCTNIRDSALFTNLVILTILVVGITIGIDTDHQRDCERLKLRTGSSCETKVLVFTQVITIIAQVVFSSEAAVKILAEGKHPERYFTDEHDGAWNR